MAEIVLRFFEVQEGKSGNVVFTGEYIEGFDTCMVDLLVGFDNTMFVTRF